MTPDVFYDDTTVDPRCGLPVVALGASLALAAAAGVVVVLAFDRIFRRYFIEGVIP